MKMIKKLILLALCASSAVFAGQTGSNQGNGARKKPPQVATSPMGVDRSAGRPQTTTNANIPPVTTFEDEDPASMPPAVAAGHDAYHGEEESLIRERRLRQQELLARAFTPQARLGVATGSTSLAQPSLVLPQTGPRLSQALLIVQGLRPRDQQPANDLAAQIMYKQHCAKVIRLVNAWFDACVDANNGRDGWPVWADQAASPHSVASTSVATQGGSSSPRAMQSPVDEEIDEEEIEVVVDAEREKQ